MKQRRQEKILRYLACLLAAGSALHAEGERTRSNEHSDEHELSVDVDVDESLIALTADCRDCIADAVVFSRTDGRRRAEAAATRWLAHFNDADGRSVVWLALPTQLETAEVTTVVMVDDGSQVENAWRTIHLVDGAPSTLWDFQCATAPASCRRDAKGAIRELVDTEAK
jgi:hypothetical protein